MGVGLGLGLGLGMGLPLIIVGCSPFVEPLEPLEPFGTLGAPSCAPCSMSLPCVLPCGWMGYFKHGSFGGLRYEL